MAVVGLGCRFPGGVTDASSFWELLVQGRSGIVEVPENRWNRDRYYHPDRSVPGRMATKWGGFLDRLDQFDPQFWGISPREAIRMDPQQRWLLEVAWEAIEDAGIAPKKLRGRSVGVFVGISGNDYAGLQMPNHTGMDVHTNSGCTLSIASNRISYLLDLTGPSVSVDTACSSALVAMSQACHAIWSGSCEAALTGGVSAIITPHATIGFSKASMLSPSGQCYAFDQRANGYVRGEGAAMVLIKPLRSAIRDGDPIYSVIRSAVVNQDGHTSSMTVPGVDGQTAMLRQAYREADLPPSSVVYMEAHGTGTPVGDPIEATALGNVLREGRQSDTPCLIGSVKTNVGHLESGSGIAGFVKAALVLHHDSVPPNRNFETPNPNIPFEHLGLKVSDRCQPLPHQPGRLPVVGVNSFGFGGTNAHVVLEAAPRQGEPIGDEGPSVDRFRQLQIEYEKTTPNGKHSNERAQRELVLPISARDPEALRDYASSFAKLLRRETENESAAADICHSAGVHKEQHPQRLAIIGEDQHQLADRIDQWLSEEAVEGIVQGKAETDAGDIVFVFTGQGAQWWKMGRELFSREPVFRNVMKQIDALLLPLGGWSLIEEMFGPEDESQSKIDQTRIAQPAIFALQVALSELWKSWGVQPARVIGHSVGEVAAAYVAGVYTMEDAVKIIFHRSRLQNQAGGDGRMVAAGISAAEARAAIGDQKDRVQVAVINSPNLVTLAGDREPLEAITAKLEQQGRFVRQLRINYAFHTHHMDPIRDELLEALADIQPRQSRIPFVSTVTGGVLSGTKLDAQYWWRNVRQPVLFASGIGNLVRAGERLFVELGPHPALEGSIGDILKEQKREGDVFHSLKRKTDESQQILGNLAGLHCQGTGIDWRAINQSTGRHAGLPSYPWRHDSYWHETDESARKRLDPIAHPMLGERLSGDRPQWQFQLDPRLFSYVRDHQIWDGIILPGAAFGEIGLAIARELDPERPCVVEDLEILKALFVSEENPPLVRVAFDAADRTFTIHSSTGNDQWELNSRGRLIDWEAERPETADIKAIQDSLPERLDNEAFYDDFDRAGFQFGPNFREVTNVWRVHGEALAEIVVPELVEESWPEYRIHPAVLDACFHVFRGVKIVPDPSENFFLPARVGRIRLYVDQPPTRLWSHGKMTFDDGESMITDIFVYDDQGNRIADILGFRVDRVERNDGDQNQDLFFQPRWVESPLAVTTNEGDTETDNGSKRTVVVLTDRAGICQAAAKELSDQGVKVVTATRGEGFHKIDDRQYQVSSDQIGQLLESVEGTLGVTDILHGWSLDRPDGSDLDGDTLVAAQQDGVLSALHLSQAIGSIAFETAPSVRLITRDAQSVQASDRISGLASSPMIGMARVATNEQSANRWIVIDLPEADDATPAAIASEVLHGDDEYEIAYRGRTRWVNRLVNVLPDQLPDRRRNAATTDSSTVPYRLETGKPGILTNLSWNETRRRSPGAGEIEVEMRAGGINFRDVMKALAMYPGNPVDLLWFGDDFSGTVVRVGDDVNDLSVGDEVAGMAPYSFRAFSTIDRRMAFKKPSRFSHEEAATLSTVFLTSHYALNHLARVASGEKILIHAGTGGVGQAAIQIAQHRGLQIFATAGTDEKREMLREMGVEHVLNSRTLDFADEIMRITGGKGVDVVLNSLAGEFIPKNFSVLAPFGRFLEIGKVDVYGNTRIGLQPLRNNISYFVIDLAQHLEQRTDFVASMFDELLPRFEAGDYRPLTHKTFPAADVVDAFRYMAQGKHVGKNVLRFDADALPIGPNTQDGELFRSDASYMIVGGAGGFGLEVAKWMTQQGARSLVLMSRSGPPDEKAVADIHEMTEAGVTVTDARGDVTDLEDVKRIIAQIAPTAPLAGVIHGAMVLDDRFLSELDEAAFEKVLHPKMIGAWNLHQATIELPLEHFVCFSSFSTVIGGSKQSNYNAGNFFLDALAHYRKQNGLPALTINWSSLSGAGFVERNEKTAQYLDKLGMKALRLEEAFGVLRTLLAKDPVQIGACRADWQSFARLSPLVASSGAFRELVEAQSAGDAGGSLRPRLIAASADERDRMLLEFVTEQVADVFGVDPSKVDSETSLTNLGLDSLMAIDLINRIESEFGESLPMGSILRGPNLKELAAILAGLLSGAGEESGESGPAAETSTSLVPIEKVSPPAGEFPLSDGQQALWFLYRLAPESSAYNLTFGAKFTPHVDLSLMERAFECVLSQHPMLNVVFSDRDGTPVQRLRRDRKIDYREHDATAWTSTELDRRLMQHANEPFDLEQGPVIRLEMFRLEDGHVALMSMHHIISDAWSVTVIVRDLMEAYFSLRAGRSPQLPTQDRTFEDFVAWEPLHLASETGKRMGQYWLDRIADAPKQIELPTDHPRPAVQTFRGGTLGFKLPDELSQSVLQVAAEQNVTLFTLLLSAYEVLLHRHSGQDDFLVGVPMAGRQHAELQNTVGYFVNPVPLRSDVSGDPQFTRFLNQNHDRVADGLVHQQYPMRHLVRDLDLPRDTSRSPLFQVAFSMERIPGFDEQGIAVFLVGEGGHRFHLGDLEMESVDLNLRQAQFEILLVVEEAGGNIYGCWQYNRDLFEPESIESLNDRFAQLLEQIVDDPSRPVSDYRVGAETLTSNSSAADDDRALREKIGDWNNTNVELQSQRLIHEQIEAQAAKTPERVAVVCGGQRLSYRDLNRQANRLAHHLRSMGVAPNDRVGICMNRHTDLIVTILGVLKAGGAYVPLDPNYPAQRLEQIANSAEMSLVVTREIHRDLVSDCGRVICIDSDQQRINDSDSGNPDSVTGPDDLMYVIYTSGSTGQPKGAAVYHRGFRNLVDWFVREFELSEYDRSLVVTSHGFDLTQKNLYALLTLGGEVHLSAGTRFDAGQVLDEIAQSQITLLNCTPSNMYLLVSDDDEASLQKLDSLRFTWLGGEPIDMARLASWRGREGFDTELVNTYGPTECTDICSFYRVPAESDEIELPVGHPITNVQTYVVDEQLNPVPIGTTGELCISGAGVGAGYVNDPELTSRRFVTDPFGGSTLLYRSGDLCKYRHDGAIEFVGRSDDQIKIRGNRIELGEIESALAAIENVRQAVVVARRDPKDNLVLACYLVAEQDDDAGELPARIKASLLKKLPDYMVPSHFVVLDQLPLNAHGKVDRRALPAPDLLQRGDQVAPRDAYEETVLEVWQELLGISEIGVTEHFFELGGDSMQSVELMIKLRKEFGTEIPLAVMIQGDTVAEMASYFRRNRAGDHTPLVAIQPHGERTPLFCIHPVGGNVLCYSQLASGLDADQPVYGIQARGVEGECDPVDSVEAMAEDYLQVIRELQPEGPYQLAAWSSGGVVAFEMARRLQREGQTVGLVALFDSFAPHVLEIDAEDDATVLSELAAFFNRFYHLQVELGYEELSALDSEGRVSLFRDRMRQSGFLPAEVDDDYVNRFLNVCRANLRALQKYEGRPDNISTLLFRAADPEGRSQPIAPDQSEDLGWNELVGESLEILEVEGDHVSILAGDNANHLAARLQARMQPKSGCQLAGQTK